MMHGRLLMILFIAVYFLVMGDWLAVLGVLCGWYGALMFYNRLEGTGEPTFRYRRRNEDDEDEEEEQD